MNDDVNKVSTTAEQGFGIQVGMNAVKHLGKNLYTNMAASIAELVANSWDAYATEV